MKRPAQSHLVMMVIGMVLGAIALGAVQAAISTTTEVRIGARRLDDGRVEVGLQQRGDDEGWGQGELPTARFLAVDTEPGTWFYSSEVELTVAAEEATEPVAEEEATEPAAEDADEPVVEQPAPPVMCVLGHAYPDDDRFWRWTLAASYVSSVHLGVDIRLYAASDSEEHANDIRLCLENEPIALATSLPYAPDLAEALAEAREAGVVVVTFNSGDQDAESVGSLMHIGLDDFGGGVRSGDRFDEAGVTGTVVCVIHEADNVGLANRCDGLEQGYDGGEVERLDIDPRGATDAEVAKAAIAERIAAGDVAAIMTLNHDTGVTAIAAIEEAEAEIALASFGFGDALAEAVLDDRVLFLVWDQPLVQGYTAVSAMALAYTLQLSALQPGVFLNGARVMIEPTLAGKDRVADLLEQFAGPAPGEDEQGEVE